MWHLIRVYTVCHSSSIFYTHQQVVRGTCSKCKTSMVRNRYDQILRINMACRDAMSIVIVMTNLYRFVRCSGYIQFKYARQIIFSWWGSAISATHLLINYQRNTTCFPYFCFVQSCFIRQNYRCYKYLDLILMFVWTFQHSIQTPSEQD